MEGAPQCTLSLIVNYVLFVVPDGVRCDLFF